MVDCTDCDHNEAEFNLVFLLLNQAEFLNSNNGSKMTGEFLSSKWE